MAGIVARALSVKSHCAARFCPRVGLPFGAVHSLVVVLVYAVIAAMVLGANPFNGGTVGPFDLLAHYPGWSNDAGTTAVRNPERSDVLDWLLPNWSQAREQLRAGIVPLWNPLQAAGQGLLLDPTKGLLSVAFLVFLLAPSPELGFYVGVLSNLMIAAIGMHFLVARHCGQISAFFAGISYMMCGFIVAWLYWPHTLSAIWLPWLLLAIDHCFARQTWRSVAGISASTAAMFLGGFPFVVALGLGAAIVYIAVCAAAIGGGRPGLVGAGFAVSGIGLGLALCAVPLMGLSVTLAHIDTSYRIGGLALSLQDVNLLSWPWAMDSESVRVERYMYVGMGALLLSVLGVFWIFAQRGCSLAISGVIYVAVGFCLTFGVLPRNLGTRLPVLANNPWSRAILLLDFGIILLAAIGLDRLLRWFRRGPMLIVFGLAICGAQYFDLVQSFRRFNGPTPVSEYYRADEPVRALAQSIPPFQYIVQDASHLMVSGTLAAIGFGDWFGHSLRSPAQRALLAELAEKPFTTPTATMVGIGGFRLDSPIMDAVANCYFIYSSGAIDSSDVLHRPLQGAERFALPPLNAAPVAQNVSFVESIRLSTFSVRLATYRETGLDGEVEVTLVDRDRGTDIARSVVPASNVSDNKLLSLRFVDQPIVGPGRYAFKIVYRPGPLAKRVTAWAFHGETGLAQAGRQLDAAIDYEIRGKFPGHATSSFEVIADEGGTSIAKNSGCPSGPYWTADIARPTETMDDKIVKRTSYVPHAFALTVVAPAGGYVVIPMNYQPGWTAEVNGQRRNLDLVYGLMPAIHVSRGESVVEMRYAPPCWKQGLMISTGALLLFGSVIVFSRWRRRDR